MPGHQHKSKQMPNLEENIQNQIQNEEIQPHIEHSFKFSLYEYFMSGFVVLFLLNFFYGKITNERLSLRWFNSNKSFFTYNFSHIGHENNYSKFNMSSPFL